MLTKLVSKFRTAPWLLVVLLGLALSLCSITVFGGGLDWGGGGDDTGDDSSCIPDNPLVIVPGPIGAPVRITPFDSQTYLVADYSRNKLFWFHEDGTLSLFIETLGKPLSIAINASYKRNGKLNEAFYFVGNDTERTIDVYYEDKKGQLTLQAQYPVDDDGIQALDMAYDQQNDLLYVVDGLDRDIKVVETDGQLLYRFTPINTPLFYPKGIALDADKSILYISDYGNPAANDAKVWAFTTQGEETECNPELNDYDCTILGNFSRPQGISLTASKVYFVDNILAKVLAYDRHTGTLTSLSCKGSSEGHLLLPMDVAVDQPGEKLFVADSRNMRVTLVEP